jgi:hypothetical protein
MKKAVEMSSYDMIYVQYFIAIYSGTQVILKLLSQQFKRL